MALIIIFKAYFLYVESGNYRFEFIW